MKVNDIFYSLQGEGAHTGMPAVFLRLAGCNLACPFCDTKHHTYEELSEEQITERALSYPARNIVVTGGEPLMQLTPTLTDSLRQAGFTIHLETNGTLPLPQGVCIDWITCSPKDGRMPRIQRTDELKLVYWGQDVAPYEACPAHVHSLQPLDTGNSERNAHITQLTIDYILKHPTWKLSMQTHKTLSLP